jgi:hypothetical protein
MSHIMPMVDLRRVLPRGYLRQGIVAITLFAALCRGLIPIGFMPGVVQGSAGLMLCDGMAHQTHHGGQPAPGTHTPCPFAMSGGAPLAATIDFAEARRLPQRAALPVALSLLPTAAPARHTAPRGPPSLWLILV